MEGQKREEPGNIHFNLGEVALSESAVSRRTVSLDSDISVRGARDRDWDTFAQSQTRMCGTFPG